MVAANASAAGAQNHEASWPYTFEQDGWYLVHRALIKDMALMAQALKVVATQLEGGKNLEAWQTAGLRTFWLRFGDNLHKHHDHEEQVFFPWMATKMDMPQRMSDDHKTIMDSQEELTSLVSELSHESSVEANLKTVTSMQGKLQTHEATLKEHFEEEEQLAPLLRSTFPYAEYHATTMKMVKAMGPYELPSMLAFMPDEERRAFMKREKIPGFAQSLIILPRTSKYNKLYVQPIQCVADGKAPEPQKSFLARLFFK